MRFERGVTHYTVAHIPVAIPGDVVTSRYCQIMRSIDGGTRHMCMATGEIFYNIDSRPEGCPAKEVKDEHFSAAERN